MKIEARSRIGYQVAIDTGSHQLIADEPEGVGDNAGPGPYDLLLSALAACKIMTVQMYARRKEWPLEGVEVKLESEKVHASDCVDCKSDPQALVDIITVEISFHGNLTDEQITRLSEISERCPVQRSLTSETKIRSTVLNQEVELARAV